MAQVKVITTSGTGFSDHVSLGSGSYALTITWAGSAGNADVQIGDGTTFVDLEDYAGSVINVTSNKAIGVAGGMSYRLDVNTHTSAATVTVRRTGD